MVNRWPRGNFTTQQASADDISKNIKNVKIVEFHCHIWNHREKYIQISTNMLSIGSIICEIGFKIENI